MCKNWLCGFNQLIFFPSASRKLKCLIVTETSQRAVGQSGQTSIRYLFNGLRYSLNFLYSFYRWSSNPGLSSLFCFEIRYSARCRMQEKSALSKLYKLCGGNRSSFLNRKLLIVKDNLKVLFTQLQFTVLGNLEIRKGTCEKYICYICYLCGVVESIAQNRLSPLCGHSYS